MENPRMYPRTGWIGHQRWRIGFCPWATGVVWEVRNSCEKWAQTSPEQGKILLPKIRYNISTKFIPLRSYELTLSACFHLFLPKSYDGPGCLIKTSKPPNPVVIVNFQILFFPLGNWNLFQGTEAIPWVMQLIFKKNLYISDSHREHRENTEKTLYSSVFSVVKSYGLQKCKV